MLASRCRLLDCQLAKTNVGLNYSDFTTIYVIVLSRDDFHSQIILF